MLVQFARLANVGEAMTNGAKINALMDGIIDKHYTVFKKMVKQDLNISYQDVLAKLRAEELHMSMVDNACQNQMHAQRAGAQGRGGSRNNNQGG